MWLRMPHHGMVVGPAVSLAIAILGPCLAAANTLHVRDSSPKAEAIIHGRHAAYIIRFDGPVDHAASRLQILQAGHVIKSLPPLLNSAVDVLFAQSEAPPPGHYVLHWQVASPDGEMSNGDIPFTVAP